MTKVYPRYTLIWFSMKMPYVTVLIFLPYFLGFICLASLFAVGTGASIETSSPLALNLNETLLNETLLIQSKRNRALPPPSVGDPTSLESPCGEKDKIYIESSISVDKISLCQKMCQAADSCIFFTFNSGKCGIRWKYSPLIYQH